MVAMAIDWRLMLSSLRFIDQTRLHLPHEVVDAIEPKSVSAEQHLQWHQVPLRESRPAGPAVGPEETESDITPNN
jgi:hypothetical protein